MLNCLAVRAQVAVAPFFMIAIVVGFASVSTSQTISRDEMRTVDRVADSLEKYTEDLHKEFHEHLEGQRHARKLDDDVTELEREAGKLHDLVHDADEVERAQLRPHVYRLLQLSYRITRSLERTDKHVNGSDAHTGISHMRNDAREIRSLIRDLDFLIGSSWDVVDLEADHIADAAKTLHDEFHDHLDNYETASRIEQQVEDLEALTKHMHELAHDSDDTHHDAHHLIEDLDQVERITRRIDELLRQQTDRGVLTRDWIGVEHMRDALTNVEGSSYLLRHLADKEVDRNDDHHPGSGHLGGGHDDDHEPHHDLHDHLDHDTREDAHHDLHDHLHDH